jgi:hypothetical protein
MDPVSSMPVSWNRSSSAHDPKRSCRFSLPNLRLCEAGQPPETIRFLVKIDCPKKLAEAIFRLDTSNLVGEHHPAER